MTPESSSYRRQEQVRESEILAQGFRELRSNHEEAVFETLENDLVEAGFRLGGESDVRGTMDDSSLMCRSESFSKAIDLVTLNEPLAIRDKGGANMCIIASGAGFRVAMEEGFSGSDVDGVVKTVVTFKPDHLTTRAQIPSTSELWNTKPETAQVSLAGGGEVLSEDIVMLSFRFPISYFPEHLLTETERDMLDDNNIKFVVRHYVRQKEETIH